MKIISEGTTTGRQQARLTDDQRKNTRVIVVGVEAYDQGIETLHGVTNRAATVAHWSLRTLGLPAENVHLFLSPQSCSPSEHIALTDLAGRQLLHQEATTSGLRRFLNTVVRNWNGGTSVVLLVWMGHGILDDQDDRYLLLADAAGGAFTGIRVDTLRSILRASDFPRIELLLGVIDTCANQPNRGQAIALKCEGIDVAHNRISSRPRPQFLIYSTGMGRTSAHTENPGGPTVTFADILHSTLEQMPIPPWPPSAHHLFTELLSRAQSYPPLAAQGLSSEQDCWPYEESQGVPWWSHWTALSHLKALPLVKNARVQFEIVEELVKALGVLTRLLPDSSVDNLLGRVGIYRSSRDPEAVPVLLTAYGFGAFREPGHHDPYYRATLCRLMELVGEEVTSVKPEPDSNAHNRLEDSIVALLRVLDVRFPQGIGTWRQAIQLKELMRSVVNSRIERRGRELARSERGEAYEAHRLVQAPFDAAIDCLLGGGRNPDGDEPIVLLVRDAIVTARRSCRFVAEKLSEWAKEVGAPGLDVAVTTPKRRRSTTTPPRLVVRVQHVGTRKTVSLEAWLERERESDGDGGTRERSKSQRRRMEKLTIQTPSMVARDSSHWQTFLVEAICAARRLTGTSHDRLQIEFILPHDLLTTIGELPVPAGLMELQPLGRLYPVMMRSYVRAYQPHLLAGFDAVRWERRWKSGGTASPLLLRRPADTGEDEDADKPWEHVCTEAEATRALEAEENLKATICVDGVERLHVLETALRQGFSVALWPGNDLSDRDRAATLSDAVRVATEQRKGGRGRHPLMGLPERVWQIRKAGAVGLKLLFDHPSTEDQSRVPGQAASLCQPDDESIHL